MAHQVNKLNALSVKNLSLPGRHSDGNGLYLNVSKTGAKSWVWLFQMAGRRREMGLGSASVVNLSEARRRAIEAKQLVASGVDPLSAKLKDPEKTFGECSDEFIAKMEPNWRNDKHIAQWKMTLQKYAGPIREVPISKVSTHHVVDVLEPLWHERPETAYRLMGRIERVLSASKSMGLRSGENPAQWKGHLENILPARRKLVRGHHKAMAYRDVPSFVSRLQDRGAMTAIALEFTILTAARSGEVRGAKWDEFDLDLEIWSIPADRMKSGRPHRIPLSKRALQLVREAKCQTESRFVFAGPKPTQKLSENAMSALLKRMDETVTVHGFRSSFRDWAAEEAEYPNEVCEMALAHSIRNATERAYRRGDLFSKRRDLMNEWAEHCGGTLDE